MSADDGISYITEAIDCASAAIEESASLEREEDIDYQLGRAQHYLRQAKELFEACEEEDDDELD